MTLQWIDKTAGLAYVTVRGPVVRFTEFLSQLDSLITHPNWRPGMPIVEDLREISGVPPASCLDEWREYVAARRPVLAGCRWAVVLRADDSALAGVLDAVAAHAAACQVTLQRFSDMIDAHAWVQPSEM